MATTPSLDNRIDELPARDDERHRDTTGEEADVSLHLLARAGDSPRGLLSYS